jgi:hypothetical protein
MYKRKPFKNIWEAKEYIKDKKNGEIWYYAVWEED